MKDSNSSPEKILSKLQEKSKTLFAKFEELRGFL
jgi:hypothetical protein